MDSFFRSAARKSRRPLSEFIKGLNLARTIGMQLRSDIISLFVVGVTVALFGWGFVYLSAKLERERRNPTRKIQRALGRAS